MGASTRNWNQPVPGVALVGDLRRWQKGPKSAQQLESLDRSVNKYVYRGVAVQAAVMNLVILHNGFDPSGVHMQSVDPRWSPCPLSKRNSMMPKGYDMMSVCEGAAAG